MNAPFSKRLEVAAVTIILIAAFLLRFHSLGTNPPGLFHDEFEKGYTAFELIRTGRHGVLGADGIDTTRPFPLFIEVYEGHDRTSAIYQYLTAPIVGVFGLGPATTRVIAALSGWMAVAMVWLFARRRFGAAAALVALVAMAFQPAAIAFSRWAQQGILLLPLVTAGFLLLWEVPTARRKRRRVFAVAGAVLLGIAVYTYAPARLVVPLILVAFCACMGRESLKENRRAYIPAALLFLLFWIPMFVYTLSAGAARLERVGVFSGGIGSGLVSAIGNYFSHLNPLFIAVEGDANARHGLPGAGLAGWGGAILLLSGLASIVLAIRGNDERARPAIFAVLWFLMAPAAAALTNEGIPHALRANLMLPAAALIAACTVMISGRRLVYTIIFILPFIDLVQAIRGLHLQSAGPKAPWEAGLLDALEEGLAAEGDCYVSAGIPYANYAVLFADETDPKVYQERGLGALPCTILPPGRKPALAPGDVYIAPPMPPVPLPFYDEFVLIYEVRDGAVSARRP